MTVTRADTTDPNFPITPGMKIPTCRTDITDDSSGSQMGISMTARDLVMEDIVCLTVLKIEDISSSFIQPYAKPSNGQPIFCYCLAVKLFCASVCLPFGYLGE